MKRIDQLFDNLDEWRHLPAYQLERRVDAFFSLYLGELLAAKYGDEIEGIIPEFPVRIDTIEPGVGSNRSFKIDYLAKVKGKDKVFLVELKTDLSSRRGKQDWYLRKAKAAGLPSLLDGVGKIYQASHAKGKYRRLLEKLESFGLLSIRKDDRIQVEAKDYEAEIVYLQPREAAGDEKVISFGEAADHIGAGKDRVSKRFAKSLREWADVEAEEP